MNLTQEELANKYKIGQGTVSACLRAYNVPVVGLTSPDGQSRPRKLYDEKEAIEAFKRHYRDLANEAREKTRALDDKAFSFRLIYEKSVLLG